MDSNSCKDSAELLATILVPSVAAVIDLLIYVCSKCTYHVSTNAVHVQPAPGPLYSLLYQSVHSSL